MRSRQNVSATACAFFNTRKCAVNQTGHYTIKSNLGPRKLKTETNMSGEAQAQMENCLANKGQDPEKSSDEKENRENKAK